MYIKYITTTSILLLLFYFKAFATWSIIIIDPKTMEIGIAGASCSHNCYGIGAIVPGKGAIIVQAMSNNEARAKGLQLIVSDLAPEDIINEIRKPKYDPERQQYAVITRRYLTPSTYTGTLTNQYNGALTAKGISIQGNTLSNPDEIEKILNAALKAQEQGMSIDAILMIALEAGSIAGGDKRCGEQKATSAFITIVKPNDNAKKPYLDLVIFGQVKGGQNAVLLLKDKYEKWKQKV